MIADESALRDRPVLRDTRQQDRPVKPPSFWVRYRRLAILLGACGLAAAGVLLFIQHFGAAQESVPRSSVTVATVERGSFVRDIVAAGQVVAAISPTLQAQAPGTVTLKVHAGDSVAKDQVVAVIDSPELRSKLSQEDATLASFRIDWKRAELDAKRNDLQVRAAYNQAKVDLKTAQREADRSHQAFELGSYSELQAMRADDAREKAQFAYDQAELLYQSQPEQSRFEIASRKSLFDRQQYIVDELHRQVDALQVRSPVSGRVGQVWVGERATALKDTPLLTVVDLSALEVEIHVPETQARDLRANMAAELEADGRKWKAVVKAVSPEVVGGEVTARLRLSDPSLDGLRQSQRLSARIYLDRRPNVLMVDRGLFVEQGGGFAYLLHGNIAERRPVRLGAASVDRVEILQGAAVGDKIVISGADAFHNADRVRLTD